MILSGITISGGGLLITPAGGAAGPIYPGTSYGYTGTPAITRYSYASDGNAVSVGTLQSPGMNRSSTPGQASETNGYVAGSSAISTPGEKRWIQKYSYASATTNAAVSALLTGIGKYSTGGASSKAQGYGYVLAGDTGDPSNTTEKFSFSADTNATAVGVLTGYPGGYVLGLSSSTNGYTASGNSIRKFPFATDSNAVVTASLSNLTSGAASYQSSCSTTDGFVSGIYDWPNYYMGIQKFSFSSDNNSANVGAILYQIAERSGSTSSTTFGYQQGGQAGPLGNLNKITKFPYAAGGTATDVGVLTVNSLGTCGTQI